MAQTVNQLTATKVQKVKTPGMYADGAGARLSANGIPAGDEPFVDIWVDRSIRYWTSAPQGIAEALVGGDVRVIRAVQLR